MISFMVENKKISVYSCDKPNSPIIYLNIFDENEEENIYNSVKDAENIPFNLVFISGLNWEYDMTPWNPGTVFKDTKVCFGGADEYLKIFTNSIIPKVEKEVNINPCWRGIVGYSLGGLFALYCLYKTNIFSRAASISGSLWFPDFKEYVFLNEMNTMPECIYFSLGDKECRTQNVYLKSVQITTEEIEKFYKKKQIITTFKLNKGNHYQDVIERSADGIKWVLEKKV